VSTSNYVLSLLLICKEIGRESREVIGTGVRISLSARSVEFEGDDRAAPRLSRGARCNVEDSAVDGLASRKRCRRVPNVERESQRFPAETLRQHNTFGSTFWHVCVQERHWSRAVLGGNWEAVDRDDSGTFWIRIRRKQYGRNFNDLRLRWWRCSDHVVFSLCGKTLLAMTRPITLEMLWRAVPGLLTAGAPHRSRSAAQRAWVINKRSAAHSVRGGV